MNLTLNQLLKMSSKMYSGFWFLGICSISSSRTTATLITLRCFTKLIQFFVLHFVSNIPIVLLKVSIWKISIQLLQCSLPFRCKDDCSVKLWKCDVAINWSWYQLCKYDVDMNGNTSNNLVTGLDWIFGFLNIWILDN